MNKNPRTFFVRGIGNVTPRKGQSRESAERIARRNHGRKTLGLSVEVPGLGRVRKNKGERFRDAVKRVRKARPPKRVDVFTGAEEVDETMSSGKIAGDTVKAVKRVGVKRRFVDLEVTGFRQVAPLFDADTPWTKTVTVDVDGASAETLHAILRQEIEINSSDNIVLTSVQVFR